MRILAFVVYPALLAFVFAQPSTAQPAPQGPELVVGGFVGYLNGPGGQVFVSARELAEGFPVMLRLRAGLAAVEPGSPQQARQVFINNATNGTPQEAGRTFDLGLDGLYPIGSRTHLVGGVRYTRFLANFNFIGGNEDFDVTSEHWGLAAGFEATYPMGPRMALLLFGAGEYLFPARLSGHDTSYSPDGDDVNPRKDFTFTEADDAVEQPTWRPVLLLGVSYRLGG